MTASQPAYLTRKREKRRAGFLSVLSIAMIVLMISFELGAVLFIRHRLGLAWQLDERKQETAKRMDTVRKGIRKLKPVTEYNRNELDWVTKELNILAGYYSDNEYKLDVEDVRKITGYVDVFEELWESHWSKDSYLIDDVRLSFDRNGSLLNLPTAESPTKGESQ